MRYLLLILTLLLPACGTLTPQQRETTTQILQDEYAAGNITLAQRDAAIEALRNDQPFDWSGLGIVGANLLLALLGAPLIVRAQRGPPTQKVGLPESKIVKKS